MGSIDINKTEMINVSPERAWQILAHEFTDVGLWSRSIASSGPNPAATKIPDGADHGGRVCDVPGFGKTDERFINYDAEAMTFTYSVAADKLPGFVRNMRNTWTVAASPGGTARVTSRIQADATGVLGALMGPMMKMKFKNTIGEVMEDLSIYAESGRISAAKQKQLAKAGRG